MIEIKPFHAWRYSLAAVDELRNVVSLPYDKISDSHQEELFKRHPYNVVRLIKPLPREGDHPEPDPYKRAAQYWNHWRMEGILEQDEQATLTLYSQRGPLPGGGTFERHCIQAVVRITPYGPDGVRRHEQTLAKPLSDRLRLMQATKANLGHIFSLYPDEDGGCWELLQPVIAQNPYATSIDEDGVEHAVSIIRDEAWIADFRSRFADKYLIIADGHHRYETAARYAEERRLAGGHPEEGFNFVMMSLCGMTHPGLSILSTHRVLRRFPAGGAELKNLLARAFEVRELSGWEELVERTTKGPSTRMGWYSAEGRCLELNLLPEGWSIHPQAASYSPVERDLSVSILHRLIVEQLLGFSEEEVRQEAVLSYVRIPEEGREMVNSEGFPGMFLLPPTIIGQVAAMTDLGKVMPQKSTDFYPKVWSGFTFRDVDDTPAP